MNDPTPSTLSWGDVLLGVLKAAGAAAAAAAEAYSDHQAAVQTTKAQLAARAATALAAMTGTPKPN